MACLNGEAGIFDNMHRMAACRRKHVLRVIFSSLVIEGGGGTPGGSAGRRASAARPRPLQITHHTQNSLITTTSLI